MARFVDVTHLPNSEQVAQRLETIADERPPGHRVFLRELADRIRQVTSGEMHLDQLCLDGWLLGQHPGNDPHAD